MQSSFLITEIVEANVDPFEEFDDDFSCISENLSSQASLGTETGSVIDPKNYFGLKARDNFGKRSRWLANQRKLLMKAKDLGEKTLFESGSMEDYTSECSFSDDDSLDGFDAQSIEEDVATGTITSPRTKYIASCLNGNMNPRMSLLVRKRVSPQLNLQHLGMGDDLGKLFAEALKELPYVDTINISDNNLRDKSLGPIITSIINLPTVTHLDISTNNLDRKSAAALADYLHTPNCPLRNLILKKSDIDDDECHKFVAALSGNTTLQELDLSNNIIGQTETLNVLQPDLITGGEALAALLASNTCQLSILHLAWNMIRLDGAIALADCLAINKYLTYLDLSYNTLGKNGGEHLGASLLDNRSLKTLLLANNTLNFSACFAICVGIEENYSLRKVQMDGNPIGEGGARVLMQIPFTAGNRVKVSAAHCNMLIRDVGSKFDARGSPVGFYELALDRPYERAICIKLLRLVASNSSYSFLRCAYDPRPAGPAAPPASSSARTPIGSKPVSIPAVASELKLKAASSFNREDYLDDDERASLKNLRDIERAAIDIEFASELFRKYDVDGSGALDRHEIKKLLHEVGLALEGEVFDHAMDLCDVDNSGELDEEEFLDFIRSQKEDAGNRIKELTEVSIMVTEDEPTVKYCPPTEGTMYMHISDSFSSKTSFKVISAVDHSNIMEVVRKGVDSVSTVLEFCIQNAFLKLKEARYIYSAMLTEVRDPAKVLSKILPRMACVEEAKTLILQYINFDKVALRNLERILGNALRPIIGQWNGYYDLDLSDEMDRICLTKILLQNEVYIEACQQKCLFGNGSTSDFSQHGDWSAFRNAIINGSPAHISSDLFKPIPVHGFVSFDFCGAEKAPRNVQVMKDSRCINLLLNLGLVQYHLRNVLEEELQAMDECSKSQMKYNGSYKSFNDSTRAENIQECMCKFYDRLPLRHDEYCKARILEGVKFGVDGGVDQTRAEEGEYDSDNDSTDSLSHVVFDDDEMNEVEKQRSIDKTRLEAGTVPFSDHSKYAESVKRGKHKQRRGGLLRSETSITIEGTERPTSKEQNLQPLELPNVVESAAKNEPHHKANSRANWRTTAGSQRDKAISSDVDGTVKAMGGMDQDDDNDLSVKASRIVSAVVDILCRVYIRARHLALLIRWFYIGRYHKTRHFGSYRVELIIALFSRVIDLHNFDLVLKALLPFEHAHVLCRLGMLQLFNPLKPEGPICLNMSRRDERMVAKMLIVLKIREPGENWKTPKFRWDFEAVKIPGWELTQPWLVDETLPEKGFLFLEYYCGDGESKDGCSADIALRKSLLHMVRIDEADIISDEDNIDMEGNKIHAKPFGAAHARNHSEIWHELLAPLGSTSARLVEGIPFFDVFPRATKKIRKLPDTKQS